MGKDDGIGDSAAALSTATGEDDMVTRDSRLIFAVVFFAFILRFGRRSDVLVRNPSGPIEGDTILLHVCSVRGDLALPHSPCPVECHSDPFS